MATPGNNSAGRTPPRAFAPGPVGVHEDIQAHGLRPPLECVDSPRGPSQIPSEPLQEHHVSLSGSGHPSRYFLGSILDIYPILSEIVRPGCQRSKFCRLASQQQLSCDSFVVGVLNFTIIVDADHAGLSHIFSGSRCCHGFAALHPELADEDFCVPLIGLERQAVCCPA